MSLSPPTTPRRRRRRARVLVATVALAAAALSTVQAASVFDLDVWMRTIDHRSVDVQKHLEGRDGDAAAADARELEQLYARMEEFFAHEDRADDATGLSRDGRQLAAAIHEAVARGDWPAASGAARDLSRACNDCHDRFKPYR